MTEEQQVYYNALVRRVDSLNRTLQNPNIQPVPKGIVTFMAGLVLRSAAAFCGDDLRDDLWSWASARQREHSGLCAFCGKRKPQAMPMCEACWKEAEAEDAKLDVVAPEEPTR